MAMLKRALSRAVRLFGVLSLAAGPWGVVGVRAGAASLYSDKINPELLTKPWSARWIAVPGASPNGYGVYHFRRAFDLTSKPASFVVHVTGDNRYQLFVNGERVVEGPARRPHALALRDG